MGGQQSMLALIKTLDRTKFNPFVIIPGKGMLSNELQLLGVPFIEIQLQSFKIKNLIKNLWNIVCIYIFIKKNKIDIIHCDFESDTLVCGIAANLARIRLLWHVRLTRSTNQDKYLFRLADGIIGVSEGCSKRFEKFKKFRAKYRTIYNGVDTELFTCHSTDLNTCTDIDRGKLNVTFIGQVIRSKGIIELMESIRLLNNQNDVINSVQFLIIGETEEIEITTRLNDLLRDFKNVKYLGFKSNINNYMRETDILVLPSHEGSEGMGRVIFEAMSCCTAIIGTEISGIKEAITSDTGKFVPEKNPQILADTILDLITDRNELERLKLNGRKRAVETFDIHIHVNKVQEFYKDLLI